MECNLIPPPNFLNIIFGIPIFFVVFTYTLAPIPSALLPVPPNCHPSLQNDSNPTVGFFLINPDKYSSLRRNHSFTWYVPNRPATICPNQINISIIIKISVCQSLTIFMKLRAYFVWPSNQTLRRLKLTHHN
ncbi:MAG: hypothetical protein CM1200mP3_14200 [Chloroflexota bacterium]|nr:MAG: hypothetical protein CM1200mP3_14200 [Chloroflexota bacterium]